ncbi:PREDICTED: testis-expressed sequence 36 protein [Ceratotherium simum simum]|uniref:Testis-expressed sequence 36 protein n=1 Tax=Ceratotherium simum simum TaxID=73337 RepID=A0ABM0I2M6_CERSS|nr:PREDICTED: testis-expressed sequence 36 protein [Ceratotherium simum simum]
MAKGRRFNPPLDKDGRWFPHIGLTQKTPESITSAMLKKPQGPRLSWQVDGKLPPIYKVREKQAVNNNFPFSVHDNRHSFQNSGYYLDSGLGHRKISPEKRQHVSRNFNLWACDYVPSCLDGFSNNQISYVYQEAAVVPIFRRFPRHYNEIWSTFKFIPERSYTEFLKKNPKVRFAIDKKTGSPLEP